MELPEILKTAVNIKITYFVAILIIKRRACVYLLLDLVRELYSLHDPLSIVCALDVKIMKQFSFLPERSDLKSGNNPEDTPLRSQ